MHRREFLLSLLASVVTATVACGSDPEAQNASDAGTGPDATKPLPVTPTSAPTDSDRVFPQGLASGDPRPDRVLLWTRVEPGGAGNDAGDSFDVDYIIARDEALTDVVGRGSTKAIAASDFTVRLLATGLEPGRHYYYRFETGKTTTRVGRTKTAPAEGTDTPIRFAVASCQDFIGRYYHSWRALLEEKLDLDFVLHLGDYIYETVNDNRFQSSGGANQIVLPDGIDASPAQDKSRIAAGTLADYRTLYKTIRSEAQLKEVHRLYPFIITWDDHEFSNDCWQDHSTYFDEKDPNGGGFTDEKSTKRRQDASRAWFEFQPADAKFDLNASFPNDITIYRTLRFGKHVELFVTDQRMYRSDHVIPEGPINLKVGKFLPNSQIGARMLVRKNGFDEVEAEKKPTLLGAAQKAWFIDAVKKSNATWKVWGNEVQVAQQAVDLGTINGIPDIIKTNVYVSTDQWDGYRSERQEILDAFSKANVTGLLVCTGDIHSFYASELQVDFDKPTFPIGIEFVCGAISSSSLAGTVRKIAGENVLLKSLSSGLVDNMDVALPASNPHLRYSDSTGNGFALVSVANDKVETTFLRVSDVENATYGGVVTRTKFVSLAGTNTIQKV